MNFEQAIPLPEILVSEVLEHGSGAELVTHGPDHWRRVANNGLHLMRECKGADPVVVFLFSLFHDSMRENEHKDDGHGGRGCDFFYEIGREWPEAYDLRGMQNAEIGWACIRHTDDIHHPNRTIGLCWDADRLDLMRVNKYPDPEYLNRGYSKKDAVIQAAVDRTWDEPPTWKELYEAYASL